MSRALELAKNDPALKQQLAAAGVPELIQAHFAKNAFCSIARFQVFGLTDEGVMESCKRLGLDKIKEEMEDVVDFSHYAFDIEPYNYIINQTTCFLDGDLSRKNYL